MSFAAHWQRHILPRLSAVPSAAKMASVCLLTCKNSPIAKHFDSHAKKGVQGSLFYLRLLCHHGKELFHLVGKQTDKGLAFRSCFLRNSTNLRFQQRGACFRGRPRLIMPASLPSGYWSVSFIRYDMYIPKQQFVIGHPLLPKGWSSSGQILTSFSYWSLNALFYWTFVQLSYWLIETSSL
ncbi:hypothetical protein T07_10450 [Trichinella nelsoni]|uniref:Uncharacterized protein n=1 Tax=Trichinella nelsoni TaxID=6336 RepID=A0A0V0SHN4_9BILA|nr:hypothetical protein T07_10450 [Trichinella nelsoni]